MLNRLLAFAKNTFLDSIRNRILYSIALFTVILLFLAILVSDWSLGERGKILLDIGLAGLSIFTLAVSIFVGITLISGELERHTLAVILARPMARWEIIVAKFVGFFGVIAVLLIGMTLFLTVILLTFGVSLYPLFFVSILGILLESSVVLAIALFFSSITKPTLAALSTVAITVSAKMLATVHLYQTQQLDLEHATFHIPAALQPILTMLYWTLPDLSRFDFRMYAGYELNVQWGIMFGLIGYTIGYVVVILLLTVWRFSRVDLR
ncbi:MAG: ABC transporter permease [bacterium]|nr:ABC transporter permease [bacterium]